MQEGEIPDEILEERVKAQIGHVLSHQSVSVRARDGHVIVEGPIRRGEKQKLVDRLKSTRGVRSFHLLVEEHGTEEELPSFHGVRAQRRKFV
jgi:hypothetical protein